MGEVDKTLPFVVVSSFGGFEAGRTYCVGSEIGAATQTLAFGAMWDQIVVLPNPEHSLAKAHKPRRSAWWRWLR